jgi:transposase, IS6 family
VLAVRWYLRYGLSYRDVEELLAERGIDVDHVTVYRWVQRFTPLLIDVARPCRHTPGDRWFVDETYVKVAGQWIYLYRAIDQFGQVIDVLAAKAGHGGHSPILHPRPRARAIPDRGHHRQSGGLPARPRGAGSGRLAPHRAFANNRIESDHDRLSHGSDRCAASSNSAAHK